jgi:two-component system sensor histidine kinase KdpD
MLLRKIDKSYQYLISLSAVVFISAICYGLSEYLPYRVVALILLLVVSLTAMLFEFAPVLVASILSAILWDYFFIPPHFTLSIGTGEDTLMLIMYFAIAFVNITLTYKIRQIESNIIVEESNANTIKLYNTLLNSLSHELRTPLSTIISATDNLGSNSERLDAKTKEELIEEISKASVRLNYQVENLLSMSRLESGTVKLHLIWCDVRDLVNSAVNKLEEELRPHKILINIPDKFPLYRLDFGLIEQALFNLLLNASQHTPKNSIIKISAQENQFIARNSTVDRVKDELAIIVEDNGKGFPQNEVNKVFDKFYRLSESGGGTGLGLSIAKGFVEAHKGSIQLENVHGGGARFRLLIPAEATPINDFKNE